jgi:hypothetical protein
MAITNSASSDLASTRSMVWLHRLSYPFLNERKDSMASLPPTKQDSYWNLMSMLNYARATRDWIGQHATSDSAMTLATLLDSFQAMAVAYYDEVEAAVQDQETLVQAYELQAALERLARQWMIIAPAIQVSAVVAEPSRCRPESSTESQRAGCDCATLRAAL